MSKKYILWCKRSFFPLTLVKLWRCFFYADFTLKFISFTPEFFLHMRLDHLSSLPSSMGKKYYRDLRLGQLPFLIKYVHGNSVAFENMWSPENGLVFVRIWLNGLKVSWKYVTTGKRRGMVLTHCQNLNFKNEGAETQRASFR